MTGHGQCYWLGYVILWILRALLFPMTVSGRENLPKKGGFILASNHLSNLDPLLIGLASGKKVSFMAKEELFRNSFFGKLLHSVNAFPIKRESGDIRSLREALRRLKAGSPLVIFPRGFREGSETAKRVTKEVQSGIGFLTVKSKVPVIPVKISGSENVMPPGAKWPRRCPVHLRFGPPIHLAEDQPYEQIADQILQQILALK